MLVFSVGENGVAEDVGLGDKRHPVFVLYEDVDRRAGLEGGG